MATISQNAQDEKTAQRDALILAALRNGQANLVGILSSLTPVLLLPLLWLIYKRRPAVGAWLGAGMAVIGTALIMAR